MDKLSRRKFIRFLPAIVAAPLAQQWQPTPEPGADTPLNLTIRMTASEARDTIELAILKEHGDLLRWINHQLLNPGKYGPERAKPT